MKTTLEYIGVKENELKSMIETFESEYIEDILSGSFEDILEQNKIQKQDLAKLLGTDEKGRVILESIKIIKDEELMGDSMKEFISTFLGFSLKTIVEQTFLLSDMLSNRLSKDYSITHRDTQLTLKEGMKFSKALNQAMTLFRYSESKRESVLIRYSQILNDKVIEGDLVLSVNPIDFYSMSIGAGWSSCLSPGGEYESGTMSYAVDNKTVLAFLISKNTSELLNATALGMSGSLYPEKKWRQVFIYDSGSLVLAGSKQYPFTSTELEELAGEEIISRIEGKDSSSIKKYPISQLYSKIGLKYCQIGYSDFSTSTGTIFTEKEREEFETSSIDISGGATYNCILCNESSADSEGFSCDSCYSRHYCDYCDSRNSVDQMNGTVDGDLVCDYCATEYFATPEDDQYELYNVNDLVYSDIEQAYYTREGYEEKFSICEYCEEEKYSEDIVYKQDEEKLICLDCEKEKEKEENDNE